MALSLEEKVDIILVLFIGMIVLHLLFFVKPEWFGLEGLINAGGGCQCGSQGCPMRKRVMQMMKRRRYMDDDYYY
jgi:hypothetical protein